MGSGIFLNLKFSGNVPNIIFYHFKFKKNPQTKNLPIIFLNIKKKQFFVKFWMILIFFGKTAVYDSCPYSKELPCKKSRKSLEPFLRKTGNYQLPTNQLTGAILWDLFRQSRRSKSCQERAFKCDLFGDAPSWSIYAQVIEIVDHPYDTIILRSS